jgi:LysM repeat protein
MYKIYKIEENDNLQNIADKFNTTTDELIAINGFNDGYEILNNQYIVVPVIKDNLFELYTIKKGDNIYKIAKQVGMSTDDLLKLNGLEENDIIYPNEEILIPKDGINFCITKNDDTISTISDKLNSSKEEIINQNETIYLLPDQLIVKRNINKN